MACQLGSFGVHDPSLHGQGCDGCDAEHLRVWAKHVGAGPYVDHSYALRAMLKRLEWGDRGWCLVCDQIDPADTTCKGEGHKPDCALAALISTSAQPEKHCEDCNGSPCLCGGYA